MVVLVVFKTAPVCELGTPAIVAIVNIGSCLGQVDSWCMNAVDMSVLKFDPANS